MKALWDRVFQWSLQYDPRTWAGHSLLTTLGGIVAGFVVWRGALLVWSLALAIGLSLALAVYLYREAKEMWDNPLTVRRKVFDHFMDILCPSLAINIVYRVLT